MMRNSSLREKKYSVFNNDNQFDIDLAYGQVKEKQLADILLNQKIEVKTDKIWHKTGNVAIEYMCSGKPSGIAVSKAPFYAIILAIEEEIHNIVIIHTTKLKDIARKLKNEGKTTFGGDNNASKMVLVPISELFKIS